MRKKILVVDDDTIFLRIMRHGLEKAGYEVLVAENAVEALDKVRSEGMQVFFLDLSLPDMDGLALCRTIRGENPAAVTIAVTSYSSVFEILKCREAGFDDYFRKPIEMSHIVQAAGEAFARIERWKSPGSAQ